MSDSVNLDTTDISEVMGFDSYELHLGDVMRGERATLGKSLLDVQRDLRIRASYISAIENCDPTAFSTPGFIAGYVRSYARYLGLDPEQTYQQFCTESNFKGVNPGIGSPNKAPRTQPILVPANLDRSNDPLGRSFGNAVPLNDGIMAQVSASGLGSIFVLLVLIFGLGYGAYAVLQDIQRVELSPIDEQPIIAALPLSGSDHAAKDAALDQLYRPKGLEIPVMTPRDGPIAALDPNRIGALVENNGAINARATADIVAENGPRVTETAGPQVAIAAIRPAWIRVSLTDGTILFEKILDGGEVFHLPQDTQATQLRAGNSGSVYLTLDGKAYGPLSNGTSVVRNVALKPETIIETYASVSDKNALEALESPRIITLNSQ